MQFLLDKNLKDPLFEQAYLLMLAALHFALKLLSRANTNPPQRTSPG